MNILIIVGIVFLGLVNLFLTKSIYKKFIGLQVSMTGCLFLMFRINNSESGVDQNVLLVLFVLLLDAIFTMIMFYLIYKIAGSEVSLSSDDLFMTEETQ